MVSKDNFNRNHPEMKDGERFLINSKDGEDWDHPSWDTIRYGEVAYDNNGNVIEGRRPVFVTIKKGM